MATTDLDFTGKTALITGSATGIGRATALEFARRGAAVVIGDIDIRAEQTVSDITRSGGRATCVQTDVSRVDQVEALVSQTVDTYGSLDIAFNNAGVLPPTLRWRSRATTTGSAPSASM